MKDALTASSLDRRADYIEKMKKKTENVKKYSLYNKYQRAKAQKIQYSKAMRDDGT